MTNIALLITNMIMSSQLDASFSVNMAEMPYCVAGLQAVRSEREEIRLGKGLPLVLQVVMTIFFRNDVMATILDFSSEHSNGCKFALIFFKIADKVKVVFRCLLLKIS